jgi:respiratory burst oxidase
MIFSLAEEKMTSQLNVSCTRFKTGYSQSLIKFSLLALVRRSDMVASNVNSNQNLDRIQSLVIKDLASSDLDGECNLPSENLQIAIDEAFSSMDTSNNGLLEKDELANFMKNAAKRINLSVPPSVIMEAVEALMEDLGASGNSHITKEQFFKLFVRHPEFLICFDPEAVDVEKVRRASQIYLTKEESMNCVREDEETWQAVHHIHWKSAYIRDIWILLYFIANLAAFTSKAIRYSNDEKVKLVFSSCIIVARGSAQCLNLNCCLILLPICRHVLTRMRATKLRFYFPFDSFIASHTFLGIAILIFTIMHVSAHVCGFSSFSHANKEDILLLLRIDDANFPDGAIDRWLYLLRTPAAITGIMMMVCMLIAYPFTLYRRQNFNSFWYTHHLLIFMLLALCFHGTGNVLEHYESVYWIMLPLFLYLVPRVLRETSYSTRKIIDMSIKKGDVVALKLERPKNWENLVRPGMYAYIKVPKVSQLEWHPFSLTSSPSDEFIEFHCATAGDWTGTLYDLVKDLESDEETGYLKQDKISNITLKVEGPIGASSQGFKDYPIIVLIGAGIGVTPMISVLKQLLVNPGKMKRVFFYWTVRNRGAFEWFAKIMEGIFETDKNRVMEVRHFLTSVKDDFRDLGAVLLHHATRTKHSRTSFDLILGQYNYHQLEIGRPKWQDELVLVKRKAKGLAYNSCGVFLCGPKAMAIDVSESCHTLNKKDSSFCFHFSKEIF